eukprot:TRINITY_DN4790_c0_g1_i2.p2 TRINITY_DN4790_c0_g1~~TRINITY_DN4790_c0_g1_i2.p2  ORF type:complete len:271 (-),score=29.74 TRINITY_DN4790_c0_g1_i2:1416-2144(-)
MGSSDNELVGIISQQQSSGLADDGQSNVREQDRFLPIANISRIMKKALPSNAKIAKDAKETVQECVSEFISFITSEASDKCQREKRKTINGDDLLWAMSTLGFEDYIEPLKLYLHKYREAEIVMQGDKNNTPQTPKQSVVETKNDLQPTMPIIPQISPPGITPQMNLTGFPGLPMQYLQFAGMFPPQQLQQLLGQQQFQQPVSGFQLQPLDIQQQLAQQQQLQQLEGQPSTTLKQNQSEPRQ